MAHILVKLTDVKLEDVKQKLKEDASAHAEQGMYLEHVWRNADHPSEVLFLFRVDDLNRAKPRIDQVHAQAREQDPNVKLPQMTFLDEG